MVNYCVPTISSRTILPELPNQSNLLFLASTKSGYCLPHPLTIKGKQMQLPAMADRRHAPGHPTLTSPILCYPISEEPTHRTPPICLLFPTWV